MLQKIFKTKFLILWDSKIKPHILFPLPHSFPFRFFPLPKSNPSNLQAPRNLQNLVAISSKMARTKTTVREVAGHAMELVAVI